MQIEEYAQARSFLRQHLSDNINELDGAGVVVILKILSHLTNMMCKLVEQKEINHPKPSKEKNSRCRTS